MTEIDARVLAITEKAVKLQEALSGEIEWIPRSCFEDDYSNQELAQMRTEKTTAQFEIEDWKLEKLGWD